MVKVKKTLSIYSFIANYSGEVLLLVFGQKVEVFLILHHLMK